jgi:hypothetical protein
MSAFVCYCVGLGVFTCLRMHVCFLSVIVFFCECVNVRVGVVCVVSFVCSHVC